MDAMEFMLTMRQAGLMLDDESVNSQLVEYTEEVGKELESGSTGIPHKFGSIHITEEKGFLVEAIVPGFPGDNPEIKGELLKMLGRELVTRSNNLPLAVFHVGEAWIYEADLGDKTARDVFETTDLDELKKSSEKSQAVVVSGITLDGRKCSSITKVHQDEEDGPLVKDDVQYIMISPDDVPNADEGMYLEVLDTLYEGAFMALAETPEAVKMLALQVAFVKEEILGEE